MLKQLILFLLLQCSLSLNAMEKTYSFDQLINSPIINDGQGPMYFQDGLTSYYAKRDLRSAENSFFEAAKRGDIQGIFQLGLFSLTKRKYEDAISFCYLANQMNMIQYHQPLHIKTFKTIESAFLTDEEVASDRRARLQELIKIILKNDERYLEKVKQFEPDYDIFSFIETSMSELYPTNDIRKNNHFNYLWTSNVDLPYIKNAIALPIFEGLEKNKTWENFILSLPEYPFVIKSKENFFRIVGHAVKYLNNNFDSLKSKHDIDGMQITLISAAAKWLDNGNRDYEKDFAEITGPIVKNSPLDEAKRLLGKYYWLGLMGLDLDPEVRLRMAADIFFKQRMKEFQDLALNNFEGFVGNLTNYQMVKIVYDIYDKYDPLGKIPLLLNYFSHRPKNNDDNDEIKSLLLFELDKSFLKADFNPQIYGHYANTYLLFFQSASNSDLKARYLSMAAHSVALWATYGKEDPEAWEHIKGMYARMSLYRVELESLLLSSKEEH